MRYALRLAKKGIGTTSPNPVVGAVIVKDNKIVGTGYHKKRGTPHAEVLAIKQAGALAENSTMFVTLEPCVQFGVTPPCADAVIEAGIKRIYIASVDPNPLVNGKGIKKLKKAGIDVKIGLCDKEARALNEIYNKFITERLPFIILKSAISVDGKIAKGKNKGVLITGEESRRFAHRLRASVDAILVGINTVLCDDPLLSTRLVRGKNPKRIVLDSNFRIPQNAKVLGNGCIIATTSDKERKIDAEIWRFPKNESGMVDIKALMREAGKREITSILVEGGRAVFTSFIRDKLVDKFYIFVGAKAFGEGNLPFLGNLEDEFRIRFSKVRRLGTDIVITGYPCEPKIVNCQS